MSKCIIVANGEISENDVIIKEEGDLLIAVDGGYDSIKDKNLKIDYLVGDMDSIDEIPRDIEIVKLNPIKDDTDTFDAIKLGIKKGYKTFYLYGCLGNRFEHSLANIQLLIFLKKQGFKGFLIENNRLFEILNNESKIFSKIEKGYFSLFSMSDESVVSIENAKYDLDKYALKNDYPLGIDNEFIGKETKITIYSGFVLLIYNKN